MLWLRNTNNVPPGEYYFRQAESGSRLFGPSPLLTTVASEVSQFRQGNSLPRSDTRSCVEDIIAFTVNRLVQKFGPSNEWIIDTDQPVSVLLPNPSGGGCGGCGAKV